MRIFLFFSFVFLLLVGCPTDNGFVYVCTNGTPLDVDDLAFIVPDVEDLEFCVECNPGYELSAGSDGNLTVCSAVAVSDSYEYVCMNGLPVTAENSPVYVAPLSAAVEYCDVCDEGYFKLEGDDLFITCVDDSYVCPNDLVLVDEGGVFTCVEYSYECMNGMPISSVHEDYVPPLNEGIEFCSSCDDMYKLSDSNTCVLDNSFVCDDGNGGVIECSDCSSFGDGYVLHDGLCSLAFYRSDNGVTIECPFAAVGDTGMVDDVEYTKVDSVGYSILDDYETICISGVESLDSLFYDPMTETYPLDSYKGDVSHWDTSSVTSMRSLFFRGVGFSNDLSAWDTSSVVDMGRMFANASDFNGDISTWDVSNVKYFDYMFNDADFFNGDLSSWDVSSATNMSSMFEEAKSFTGDVSLWNVSNVINMSRMFFNAHVFNSDLSSWNVSGVTNMSYMFYGASVFKPDSLPWDVSSVSDFSYMFGYASVFNGDISSWDTSSATSIINMFLHASSFNRPINTAGGAWDVSGVTDMRDVFSSAVSFDQPIGDWDVSSVSSFHSMFDGASMFNQDISKWNTSSVDNFQLMFRGASSFDQDISGWSVESLNSCAGFDLETSSDWMTDEKPSLDSECLE